MYKKILINIGSGYILKAIQIICGLITVPILISKDGLGLAGYGQLVVALSWIALLSMFFDGFRLVASRQIGKNRENIFQETKRVLGYFLLLSIILSLFISIIAEHILPFLGLDNQKVSLIYALLVFFVLEQLLYVTEQYFHSMLRTFIINSLNITESIFRLCAIILIFTDQKGNQLDYFYIFIGTYILKFFFYLIIILLNKEKNIFPYRKQENFRLFMRESIPLTFKGVVIFLVFRMSVLYANKVLSPEIAAVFSIIFVTIRGYLAQLFVTVIRPMIIPLLASVELIEMDSEKKYKYHSLIIMFELLTLLAVTFIAATSAMWLPLWLGDTFIQFQNIIGLAIWFLSIEIAYSLKSLVLVSQGLGGVLTKYSIVTCLLYLMVFFVIEYYYSFNLFYLVLAVIGFVFVYNGISVNYIFSCIIKIQKNVLVSLLCIILFGAIIYYVNSQLNDQLIILRTSILIWFLMMVILLIINWSPIKFCCFKLKKITS
jgi:O-antigen/teichoic acid export membrane protein